MFYILIAVALFAALGYAVSNMMRSSGESITSEKQNVHAAEVLSYAKTIRTAIQNMQISNGCDDNNISFERPPFDGSDPLYVNASAPADFSCHVFHPDGGGANYIPPSSEISSYSYFFTSELGVSDIGDNSRGEITMILRDISLKLCARINTLLDLAPPETDTVANLSFVTNGFQGSFPVTSSIGTVMGSGHSLYNNQPTGCFFENGATAGEYFFYQVLLAR